MSSKKFITVKRKGNKQAVPISKRKPYGIQRELAYDEVQKLRKEGNKARLIETNRKRNLYAAYEGTIPVETKQSSENTGDNKEIPDKKQLTPQPVKKRVPKETIELLVTGEKPYIARIIGPDKTYHYKREFIQQIKTHEGGSRKHPIYNVYFKGKLPYGAILDTERHSYMVVPKSKRFPHGLRKIGTEGMDNRLKMNRLFEARDRAGYDKKVENE